MPSVSIVNAALVPTRRQRRERCAHPFLRVGAVLRDDARDGRGTEAFVQLVDAARHRVRAGDQGLHVADDLVGRSTVAGDDAQHVVRGFPTTLEPYRREQKSFDERVRGERRESTGGHATDVGDVDERSGEVHDPTASRAVGEDRPEHDDVVGVDPAAVGVVQCEDVALHHVVGRDVFEQRRERAPQAGRVHQTGRGRQRNEPCFGVEQRRAGVGTLLDERAVAGAHDDDARLFGRHDEGIPHDLGGDRVVGAGHRRAP